MKPGCIGKSNTNNLLAPTDVTENLYRKKNLVFKDATQKSASMVLCGIPIELVPWSPIFEKCSHLREKGGVLTLRTPVGFALTCTPTVPNLRTDGDSVPLLDKFSNVHSMMFGCACWLL